VRGANHVGAAEVPPPFKCRQLQSRDDLHGTSPCHICTHQLLSVSHRHWMPLAGVDEGGPATQLPEVGSNAQPLSALQEVRSAVRTCSGRIREQKLPAQRHAPGEVVGLPHFFPGSTSTLAPQVLGVQGSSQPQSSSFSQRAPLGAVAAASVGPASVTARTEGVLATGAGVVLGAATGGASSVAAAGGDDWRVHPAASTRTKTRNDMADTCCSLA
jgi:hypothetical protein